MCKTHYIHPGVTGYSCPDATCGATASTAGTVKGSLVKGGPKPRRSGIKPRPIGATSGDPYVRVAGLVQVALRRAVHAGTPRGAASHREAALALSIRAMERGY